MVLSQQAGLKELAASLLLMGPQFEAEMGNAGDARAAASKALAIAKDRQTRMYAAVLLAATGDSTGSEKIFAELARQYPNDTMIHAVWIPIARASSEMRRNNAGKAVELMESARPYELGSGPRSCRYWANYVRAEAYLKAREGRTAAAEYQKILDHRGVSPTSPLYSLARVGLARAYVLEGDTAKARTAFQDFFAVWKDSDPDIPILKQAKAEYAKLQ